MEDILKQITDIIAENQNVINNKTIDQILQIKDIADKVKSGDLNNIVNELINGNLIKDNDTLKWMGIGKSVLDKVLGGDHIIDNAIKDSLGQSKDILDKIIKGETITDKKDLDKIIDDASKFPKAPDKTPDTGNKDNTPNNKSDDLKQNECVITFFSETGINGDNYPMFSIPKRDASNDKTVVDNWFNNYKQGEEYSNLSITYPTPDGIHSGAGSVHIPLSFENCHILDYIRIVNHKGGRTWYAKIAGFNQINANTTNIRFVVDWVATFWDTLKFMNSQILRRSELAIDQSHWWDNRAGEPFNVPTTVYNINTAKILDLKSNLNKEINNPKDTSSLTSFLKSIIYGDKLKSDMINFISSVNPEGKFTDPKIMWQSGMCLGGWLTDFPLNEPSLINEFLSRHVEYSAKYISYGNPYLSTIKQIYITPSIFGGKGKGSEDPITLGLNSLNPITKKTEELNKEIEKDKEKSSAMLDDIYKKMQDIGCKYVKEIENILNKILTDEKSLARGHEYPLLNSYYIIRDMDGDVFLTKKTSLLGEKIKKNPSKQDVMEIIYPGYKITNNCIDNNKAISSAYKEDGNAFKSFIRENPVLQPIITDFIKLEDTHIELNKELNKKVKDNFNKLQEIRKEIEKPSFNDSSYLFATLTPINTLDKLSQHYMDLNGGNNLFYPYYFFKNSKILNYITYILTGQSGTIEIHPVELPDPKTLELRMKITGSIEGKITLWVIPKGTTNIHSLLGCKVITTNSWPAVYLTGAMHNTYGGRDTEGGHQGLLGNYKNIVNVLNSELNRSYSRSEMMGG